jgi:TetR/AcrR family transcriptional regulator, mexJK operon transcriptional repressor
MTRKSAGRGGNRRSAEAASRVALILRVAKRLFLREGYANTSLNDIIALAGGSKATLRKYFKDKAGLFSAVIADVSTNFVASAHLKDIVGAPEEVLRAFGEIVLRFYLAEESLAAYRGVVAEGVKSPAMARSFYEQGHCLVQAALAERLAAWHRTGLVVSANALDDADLFLHLIRAGIHEQCLIGLRQSPGRPEISARISSAVRIFLHGVGNRRPGGKASAS